MKKLFNVYVIPKEENPHFGKGAPGSGDEYVGGSHEYINAFSTEKGALSYAKKQSLKEKVDNYLVWEIYVLMHNENDGFGVHWYFQYGKLSFKDSFDL